MKLQDLCLEKLYLILVTSLLWISAGIGMIIGRYKMAKMLGGTLEMVNVSPSVRKIFEMSGVVKICPIREAS